jgi:hypothetical protein
LKGENLVGDTSEKNFRLPRERQLVMMKILLMLQFGNIKGKERLQNATKKNCFLIM